MCLALNSYSLSLSNVSSFLSCAFTSYNSSCLYYIKNSAVYPYVCILFGGRFPLVTCIPCTGAGILIAGTAKYYCAGAADRGAFGCDGTPGRIVACAGVRPILLALLVLGVPLLQ